MKELRPTRKDIDKIPEKWWETYNPKGINEKFYNNMPLSFDVSEIREFLALRRYHNRLSEEFYLFDYDERGDSDAEWAFVQDECCKFTNFMDLVHKSKLKGKRGFGKETLSYFLKTSVFCYVYRFRKANYWLIPKYYGDRILETGSKYYLTKTTESEIEEYFDTYY